MGTLPAGLANISTVPGHPGNYKVGSSGAISAPYCLYDASGNEGGSALWTEFQAADQAIQFDQVVNLSGAVISPLIRMSADGQAGYGAFINWSTPKIQFVALNADGAVAILSSPSIPSYEGGAKVTIKLEVQGVNLRFKCWPTGAAEPSTWTATTTDSTITAAGYGGFSSQGGAVDNVYIGPAETTFSGGFLAPVLSSGSVVWNSAQLEWTAASQSGGTIAYQLLRSMHGADDFSAVSGATGSPFTDGAVEPSSGYDYMVRTSDGVNAPVDSNEITLTTPAAPASTTFTLTGPSWGGAGRSSELFQISPNGTYTGRITITPSGCGLSTPIILTFAGSSSPQTFSLTPVTTGTITLTATNSGGLQNPAAFHFTSTAIAPFVMGSGESIGLIANGSITAVATGNAVQTLTLAGLVLGSGSTFALSFDGQTTGAIAESVTYPTCYGKYTIPTTVGTQYVVAFNLSVGGGANSLNTLVQVFDGAVEVSSQVVNQYSGTPDAVIPNVDGRGNTVYMKNLVTYTATSSTLTVWVTTDNQNPGNLDGYEDNQVVCDCVSLKDVATGAIAYYDDSNTAVFSQEGMTNIPSNSGVTWAYDGGMTACGVTTVGGVQFSCPAASIQSALQSLSNIGAGNITVTGSNPYSVMFIGSLGFTSQPLITCTDPAVKIVQAQLGGVIPTYTVTHQGEEPGEPIPIGTYVWGEASGAIPYLMMPLPQSYPDSQYYFHNAGYCQTGSNWNSASSGGLSGQAVETSTTGDQSQTFAQGLPPATYQVSITWVSDTGLASSIPVTIVDEVSNATLLSTTLNQSIALGSGEGDFTQDGYSWRVLGSVTITYPSTGIVITITNPGGKIAFDSLLISRTSTNLTQTILKTDTVSVDFPAGMIVTANGLSPAFSGTIPNFAGGQTSFQAGGLGAVPSVTPTMPVGYNVADDSYFNPCLIFSDQSTRLTAPLQGSLTQDANGYPTLLSSQQPSWNALVLTQNDEYGLGLGQPAAPYGYWTVQWDDTQNSGDTLALTAYVVSANEVMEYRNYTGTTKQRVFNIQPVAGSGFAPNICLSLISGSAANGSGHYPFSINNFHIYPPDPSDPTGMTPWGVLGTSTPPRFWPNYVAKYAGAKVIRYMNWHGANNGQAALLGDFRQIGMLKGVNSRSFNVTVTAIGPATTPYQFDNQEWIILEATTPDASQIVNLVVGTISFTGTIELSNSTTITGSAVVICAPVSSTTFQMRLITNSATGGVTMTNTLSGSFTFGFGYSSSETLADAFTLSNQLGADMWLTLPTQLTDTGMTQVAQYAASNLNPGLKIYVEFGNEDWNFGLASWQLCCALTWQHIGSEQWSAPGQVIRGAVLHNAFVAAFTTANRANDVIRVVGTQAGNPAYTSQVISVAQANSISFDLIAAAPYFDPFNEYNQETEFQSNYDLMTPYGAPGNVNSGTGGQSTDWYELMASFNNQPALQIAAHVTALSQAGMSNVVVGCYEGGPQILTPNASLVNAAYRSHVVFHHPRAYHWMLAWLQNLQQAGAVVFCQFDICGANYNQGSYPNFTFNEWSTFIGDKQGLGTGTMADTVNATDPEQLNQILAETAGAMHHWNSLLDGAIATTSEVLITHQGAKGQGPHGTQGRTFGA